MKFPAQMQCSLDSGLIVVVFIISCLLWVVGLLLFYDFGNICDKAAAVSNDSSMVRLNILELLIEFFNSDIDTALYTLTHIYH